MKRLIASFLLASTTLLAGCDNMARWAYDTAISAETARAGLAEHTLTTADGIDWHYLRSEDAAGKPVVLLVHGFGADSSNWVRMVNELEGQYDFVVPDLPGHGASSREADRDYRIDTQAARLLTLMSALEIDQFHMAGNSMGGHITLATARLAPQRVVSMGLIDAAGITLRTPEFAELSDRSPETNPLIARSPEDMFTVMDWAMADPPYMPDFFVEVMGEKKAANAATADKVWNDLQGESAQPAGPYLESLTTPALILWGAKDRLLGLDNAEIFHEKLPVNELVVFDDIGHVPMAEAPARTADVYDGFWQSVETQRL